VADLFVPACHLTHLVRFDGGLNLTACPLWVISGDFPVQSPCPLCSRLPISKTAFASACPLEPSELHLVMSPMKWRKNLMARKYSRSTSKEVKNEMHRYKRGKAKSGKGGRVKSRKQAIAIALSKARKKGKKAPKKKAS
jgi:Family of unknown function (DUF6496)